MKWQYTTFKMATTGFSGGKLNEETFTDHLNDLGDQGWELVAAIATNQGTGSTRDVIVIFKRPTE